MRYLVACFAMVLCLASPVFADGNGKGPGKAKGSEQARSSRAERLTSETKDAGAAEQLDAQGRVRLGRKPPGLEKKDKMPKGLEKKEKTPPGWSKGKKEGWDKKHPGKEHPGKEHPGKGKLGK